MAPPTGSCYIVECISETEPLSKFPKLNDWEKIIIKTNRSLDHEIECLKDETGNKKTVEGFNGYILCPDITIICSNYPCRNRGYRYSSICICQPGFYGEYCENSGDIVNDHSSFFIYTPTQSFYTDLDQDIKLYPSKILPGGEFSINKYSYFSLLGHYHQDWTMILLPV